MAKFNYFQDKEKIKKAATEKLKNSRYSVGDQYPVEIQQRRRKLVPVLKKAQSESKRAVLVYDKLYINGSRYVEQSQESNMVGHQRYNERQTHGNEYGYYPMERRVQDNALGEQNKNNIPGLRGIHTHHCSVTVIKVFLPYPIDSHLLKPQRTSVAST